MQVNYPKTFIVIGIALWMNLYIGGESTLKIVHILPFDPLQAFRFIMTNVWVFS